MHEGRTLKPANMRQMAPTGNPTEPLSPWQTGRVLPTWGRSYEVVEALELWLRPGQIRNSVSSFL